MAKDFRATQVETTKIILSGGIASSTIGGAIYSGSVSTNRAGGIPAAMLTDVGTDVFLFVSGTKSNGDFSRSGVTLFGGDVVVSGTMYAERQVIEVDGIVDGDLIVTGNLLVKPDTNSSISADFRNAANASLFRVDTTSNSVVINEESNSFNFRVESNNKENAVRVDGATDRVLILSGGAGTSYDEASGLDVSFYVSGSRNSAGTSNKGTSVFGGDTVVSGSAFTGLLTVEATDPTITFKEAGVEKGVIGINSSDNILIENKTPNKHIVFKINDADGGGAKEALRIDGAVSEVIINQGDDSLVDFRVETDSKTHAIFTNGSKNQVLILSGGAGTSYDEASGLDVSFYVSGAIGSRGTSMSGSALFGGDVVHSGSVTILDPGGSDENLRLVRGPSGNNYIVFEDGDGQDRGEIYSNGAHLFLRSITDDLIFRAGTTNVLRMDGGTARVGIGNDVASPTHMLHVSGTQSDAFRVDTGTRLNAILVEDDRVLILSGGAGSSNDQTKGTDISFHVSGTVGSSDGVKSPNSRVSSFGGDLVVSGNFHLDAVSKKLVFGQASSNIYIKSAGPAPSTSDFLLDLAGDCVRLGKDVSESFGAPATDTNIHFSGSKGSRGTGTRGTSVFEGDHVVSGSTVTLAGVYRSTAFKTSNFNVEHNDHFLFIDSSAGHVTASLQSAAAAGAGRELVFKDAAGYAGEVNNRIVIKPAGSDMLEGIADETKIEVLSGSISIISDGVGQYYIVGVRD